MGRCCCFDLALWGAVHKYYCHAMTLSRIYTLPFVYQKKYEICEEQLIGKHVTSDRRHSTQTVACVLFFCTGRLCYGKNYSRIMASVGKKEKQGCFSPPSSNF